eukprot:3002-Chlamydomonas_euryale.AAC.1
MPALVCVHVHAACVRMVCMLWVWARRRGARGLVWAWAWRRCECTLARALGRAASTKEGCTQSAVAPMVHSSSVLRTGLAARGGDAWAEGVARIVEQTHMRECAQTGTDRADAHLQAPAPQTCILGTLTKRPPQHRGLQDEDPQHVDLQHRGSQFQMADALSCPCTGGGRACTDAATHASTARDDQVAVQSGRGLGERAPASRRAQQLGGRGCAER